MPRNLIKGDLALKQALRAAVPEGPTPRIGDGDGLYLLPYVKGKAHGWRFDYTSPVDGKRRTLSLGTFPDVSLALARQKAQDARAAVARGDDPSAQRQAGKAARKVTAEAEALRVAGRPAAGSFEAVAREWWETLHSAQVSEVHAARSLTRLEQDAFPWIGVRAIGELKAADVLACARRVVDRGAIETAHRLKDACGQVFRFGVAKGLCERDPVPDLKGALPPPTKRHLAALTDPGSVGQLLRDAAGYQGQPTTRLALALSALVFLRPGELRHLEWTWVNWEDSSLLLPSGLMKRTKAGKATGQPHWVPLADQALTLLRELQAHTGGGRYLFPALTSSLRPMSENTVRSALRRLGYDNDDMTAHGFRAMARTMAVERLEIPAEVVEAQLAHAVEDALGRAYNRTEFREQRRVLMQRWADYLDRLRQGAEVVPLPSRAA